MNKIIWILSCAFLLSCNGDKNIPDVSEVKVNIETKRFEQDFFGIDTSNIAASMAALLKKYPGFTPDFVNGILGLSVDSLLKPGNQQHEAIKMFITDYKPLKDSVDLMYKDFTKQTKEIKKGLQFVKYYFPKYKLPESIITFIGPFDASFLTSFGTQGDILTRDGLGIGLQLHLGSNFSFYKSPVGQSIYPDFISQNFDAAHIPVNSIRNIVDDMFPYKSAGAALIEQMVEKGKRIYLTSKFLPETPDYILMEYSKEKMKAAKENEAVIWDFFLNNGLLNNAEQNILKNYIGESPKTQEFGENSPGNLGSYAGLQIVRKYMEKYPETKLEELMKMNARKVYSLSKYKPRN